MTRLNQRRQEFGTRLRSLRETRGLSQEGLATRSKLQPSAISHFETGARKPSVENLLRLADALEATTDYLLGRVDNPGATPETDRLRRHFDRLTTEDREVAEEFLKILTKKAERQARKEEQAR